MYQDRHVCLVDTPGFDDGTMSDIEILDKIALWVNDVFVNRERISSV